MKKNKILLGIFGASLLISFSFNIFIRLIINIIGFKASILLSFMIIIILFKILLIKKGGKK